MELVVAVVFWRAWARHDLSLEKLVVRDVGQYLLQYVTDERGLMIQNDGKRICRL